MTTCIFWLITLSNTFCACIVFLKICRMGIELEFSYFFHQSFLVAVILESLLWLKKSWSSYFIEENCWPNISDLSANYGSEHWILLASQWGSSFHSQIKEEQKSLNPFFDWIVFSSCIPFSHPTMDHVILHYDWPAHEDIAFIYTDRGWREQNINSQACVWLVLAFWPF